MVKPTTALGFFFLLAADSAAGYDGPDDLPPPRSVINQEFYIFPPSPPKVETSDGNRVAGGGLAAYLLSPGSIAQQKAILFEACSQAPDQDQCVLGVDKYWPAMAKVQQDWFCNEFRLDCYSGFSNCDLCVEELVGLGHLMADSEVVGSLLTHMQGPAYCRDGGEHTEDCEEHIANAIPTAMALFSKSIPKQGEKICHSAFGICEHPEPHGGLKAYFLSPASLAKEKSLLRVEACSQAPDKDQCVVDVTRYWSGMAKVLQDWFCNEFRLDCYSGFSNCGLCVKELVSLGNLMASKRNMRKLVAHMQGLAYCGDGGEHTEDCEGNIANAIPAAMAVLSKGIPARREGICHSAFGICEHPEPARGEVAMAGGGLKAYLLSRVSLAKQKSLLRVEACAQAPDQDQCVLGVNKYWPGMAKVLQDWFCHNFPLNCNSGFAHCAFCVEELVLLGQLMANKQIVKDLVAHMQGPAYCADGGEHTEDCEENIANAIPAAMEVLGKGIPDGGEGICQSAFGICELDVPHGGEAAMQIPVGTEGLKAYLLSTGSLAKQMAILFQACSQAPDPDQCLLGIKKYWPGMAKVLQDWFCQEFKLDCYSGFSNCDLCVEELDLLGALMDNSEIIQDLVVHMQGWAYCGDGGEHTEDCKGNIAKTIPAAMAALSKGISEGGEGICQSAFGICENDVPLGGEAFMEISVAAGGLKTYLLSPASLGNQKAILAQACRQQVQDYGQCLQAVTRFWNGMAKVLQDWFCQNFQLNCNSGFSSCSPCVNELNKLGRLMASKVNMRKLVAHMQGPAYCGDGKEHTEDCEGNIANAIPAAMEVLSQAIPARGEGICHSALGICEAPGGEDVPAGGEAAFGALAVTESEKKACSRAPQSKCMRMKLCSWNGKVCSWDGKP